MIFETFIGLLAHVTAEMNLEALCQVSKTATCLEKTKLEDRKVE